MAVECYGLQLIRHDGIQAQEILERRHATFRDWFINIPGKLVKKSRHLELKIYENYYFKENGNSLKSCFKYAENIQQNRTTSRGRRYIQR